MRGQQPPTNLSGMSPLWLPAQQHGSPPCTCLQQLGALWRAVKLGGTLDVLTHNLQWRDRQGWRWARIHMQRPRCLAKGHSRRTRHSCTAAAPP